MTESLSKSRIDCSYFDSLPNELIYKILCCDSIDLVDLKNLSYTCKRLNHLCSGYNNELWKIKFRQRWPALYNRIYANSLCSTYGCWRDELRSRYLYGKETREILQKISHEQYFDGEMNFTSFDAFTNSHRRLGHPNGIHFQIDELDHILNDDKEHKNLTVKYYAKKVLRFLKHTLLRSSWVNYFTIIEGGIEPVKLPTITVAPCTEITVKKPEAEEKDPPVDVKDLVREKSLPGNFIKGAILFSNWCQPTKFLDEEFIYDEITRLATQIGDQLRSAHLKNAFFVTRNGKLLDDLEAEQLETSLYSRRDCKVILECISYFLYKTWRESKTGEDEPIFIDDVLHLKCGTSLSLNILHQAIASKFGIKLILLDYPGRPMLRWRDEENQFLYVDVTNEGKLLEEDAPSIQDLITRDFNESFYQKLLRPGCVLRRLAWLIIEEGRSEGASIDLISQRNGLELLRIVSPNDSEPKLLLSRIYIHLNINLEDVDAMLREINSTDPTSSSLVMFLYQSAQSQIRTTFRIPSRLKPARKRRTKSQQEVKYAIGLIMKHEKYNYSCVIYSWDPVCAASKGWTTQMRVSSLRLKTEQPFYNVLVEDGSTRYAAQENLAVSEHPCPIPHSEIGKYFESFQGTYYKPNAEKECEYPDDDLVREQIISNVYGDDYPINY